ncbi:MAG: glycosyltransferase [Rubricoccaceae bacterium]|nr:glycosyltransferase [Rubricoccaceae bacterium]
MSKLAPANLSDTAASSVFEQGRSRVKASVVVPTLNEEKTLEKVLGPLRALAATLDLELIVSDGGSTDGTLSLSLALADRVVTHESEEPQTIAAGRNAGARQSKGDILLFFNADVEFPPNLESYLNDMIEAAHESGAATCRVAVHPNRAVLADRIVLGICNALFWGWNRLGLGMGRGECHVIRRDVFEALGGYDESLVAGEDFDLYRRIANRARRKGKRGIAFLWKHVVYEDPRRYRQRGYLRTMIDWLLNSISVSFLGRSHSRTWDAVR